MVSLLKYSYILILLAILPSKLSSQSRKADVNLMENFKISELHSTNFEGDPVVSLTGYNYSYAAFSKDMKYMAVARSFKRGEGEVKDIVLIKLKNNKESVILDTQSVIRYGRPNGYLWSIEFNNQNQLIANIGDGMEGSTILTIDVEEKTILKDIYVPNYSEDEEYDEYEEEDVLFDEKMSDLKRIFPKKSPILLSDMVYKLIPVDTVGYIIQGAFDKDNSIYFLPRKTGKLKLLHNIANKGENDNINGVWGTSTSCFYLLKNKTNNYLFQYSLVNNKITLLEKLPSYNHYSFMYSQPLKNGEILLYFETGSGTPTIDNVYRLYRYSGGNITKIENYPFLKELQSVKDTDILLLYYLKDGKLCLDVRKM